MSTGEAWAVLETGIWSECYSIINSVTNKQESSNGGDGGVAAVAVILVVYK